MFCLINKLFVILLYTFVFQLLKLKSIDLVAMSLGEGNKIRFQEPPKQCGYRRDNTTDRTTVLIMGGNLTDISEFPWQVSLQLNGNHFCGGSIIESKWVLTAAHCLDSIGETEVNSLEVIAGTQNLSQPFLVYGVSKIVIHFLFGNSYNHNDIGLIKLKRPIPLRNKNPFPANTICLPESREQTIGNTLTTIGWGVTENDKLSDQLMFVKLPFVSSEQCKAAYGEYEIIGSLICAGEEGKDSCQGDSGGGLIQRDDKGKATIVGIVSFGIGCGVEGYPGVYTKVSAFIDWIQSVIENH